MTWHETSFTHGGAGLYKQTLEAMLAEGWTLLDSITSRPGGLAAASPVQTNTQEITVNWIGAPLDQPVDLPVCMLGALTARYTAGAVVAEGTDYAIDKLRGTITPLSGGGFDGGGGTAQYSLTIDSGAELLRGWVILSSTGISTQETILVGMRLDKKSGGSPSNPRKTGIRWTAWAGGVVGVTDYDVQDDTLRNGPEHDVLQFINPDMEGVFQANVDLDRIICGGFQADAEAAWAYAGALGRLRPAAEQSILTAIAGNTAAEDLDDGGIVGDTAEPGSTDSEQLGTVYLFDQAQFPVLDQIDADLNANHWSLDASNSALGYTPSQVPVGSGTYTELHDVIAGRNLDSLANPNAAIYGYWQGLKAVLKHNARHNDVVSVGGETWRLWRVGTNPRRHIAVREV